mmetsp:Transcript_14837/g.34354  ORF Transcript_14837/g.34354 Transcript_14837/m.34354 type:complete len:644 (-) Transcript_14837:1758-3689(-)
MVWKISKHKKSEKQGGSIKQKQVLESPPKLKSCLKKKKDNIDNPNSQNDSSKSQNDLNGCKIKDHSLKSNCSRSRSTKSVISVESKGSENSLPTNHPNGVRAASLEQYSVSSRSWDRESRRSEAGQSTQTSDRSFADSRSFIEDKKKKVSFTVIYVRDYERVVGDNPSCTIGPPVGIGWKYGETRVIDVDSFEAARSYKKPSSHLILNREAREAVLLSWGASFHDIVEAVRSNLKIKNQRRQTVTNLGKVERIEEAFESATRKLKSALMLRRSTGNKVKRLQEQANLAQSALTSLKIAEDRALSEIRGARRVQIAEEPETKEDLENFAIPNYSPSSPEDLEGGASHLIVPEDDDHAGSTSGRSLAGNSTTNSELEIERFYQELELEMFGDEELPSMVGQTLEVPLKEGGGNHSAKGVMDPPDHYSVNSEMMDRDLDDALLEQEQNRSMISTYLLEDADNDSPKLDYVSHGNGDQDGNHNNYYHSLQSQHHVHTEQISSGNNSAWNSGNPLDFPPLNGAAGSIMEYQDPNLRHHQTIPLHAGMTMFEDCALLGGQRHDRSLYREKKRYSSRKKDMNAGPRVQFIPPPTHITPSHWMDCPDSHIFPSRGHDTITIFEDDFAHVRYDEVQNKKSYSFNSSRIHPNF